MNKAGTRLPRAALFMALALQMAGTVWAAAADLRVARTPASLSRLSIEELSEIEVSSVSRRPERLADAAAAVYVITREDIERSGATTLPEALRLAPNLQVARLDANSYAISARGFNSESANKLLVMIDGRSVYTPLHSGVFWDAQDVMIEDIDRIEVVSGPGGTLWGANAVNGVVNIVTRSAKDSIGTIADAVAGSDERGVAARRGLALGPDAALRVYGRSFRFDNTERADGRASADAWQRRQAGFRADWGRDGSALTLQGDAHDGRAQVPGTPDREVSGANLLARFSREFDVRSGVRVQVYADDTRRRQPGFFTEDLDTVDIDVQHHLALGARHELVWGGGYREQHDSTSGGTLLAFVPADSRLTLANVFAQDTIALGERLKLTLGLKAEHNNYTGMEYQPNVRLAWRRNEQSLVWAAVSRAIRIPSRLDRDFQVLVNLAAPYGGHLLGGPDFQSERLTACEIGYRAQAGASLSYSVSAFVNDYDRLRSVEPNGHGDFVLGNGVKGRSQGLEAWGSYQPSATWQLDAGLSLLHERLRFAPGSADPGSPGAGGNDPRTQVTLRSGWVLPHDMNVDLGLRRIGALPSPAVPAYTSVDAHWAWKATRKVQVSLTGLDLLGGRHAEFGVPARRSEFGRRVLLALTWQG